MKPELEIIDYLAEHQPAFSALNIAWIEKSFVVEEVDRIVLGDPEKYILSKGGQIIMAQYENAIVGTVALKKLNDTTLELTKMAVDENYRGLKIGYHLGVAILEKAKNSGAKKVELFSNTKGSAIAILLYRKLGFKEIPLGEKGYDRADIRMEISFE
ncbi:MAG: GNAT family N-acetyltransferase [Bacteroidia bacterium]|nr:GNAT family N-acetyltransferase [Bacteroidia bacterium]